MLIKEMNVEFKTGEFWAIIGKNGVGKTSLMHTLAGLREYAEGKIIINGNNLDSLSVLSRAQDIAILPQMQEASLDCTVEQSVSYGRYPWHQNEQEKKRSLKKINDAIKAMELSHLKDKNIEKLSGGEIRKVEIATILAQDSNTMLLDEPLNHLDIASRFKLMQLLKQLSQNKIVIIITHDIQYVQEYCSNAILVFEDASTKIGTVNEIFTEENFQKLLGENLLNTISL